MSTSKSFCRQGFNLNLNTYHYFFWICFLAIIFIFSALFIVHWAPKYPVLAKLENEPRQVLIKAPQSGFLRFKKRLSNEKLEQGQILFRVDKFRQRLFSNFYSQKRQVLENNLSKLQKEISYQRMRLKRLKPILVRQAITEDYYHQQLFALDQLVREYKQNQTKLLELRHEQSFLVQAPISGILKHLYVKNHSMVAKDEKIMLIQPVNMHWVVRVQVPVSYKSFMQPNAIFNFCLPSESKIKRFNLKAKFVEMSPRIKQHQQQAFVSVKAQVLNLSAYQTHLITGMPLQGYLVGPSKPLIWWFWHFARS